jgi:hypothetical protein
MSTSLRRRSTESTAAATASISARSVAVAKRLGAALRLKRRNNLYKDQGLLVVTWAPGSRHDVGVAHLVVLAYGVIVDPADGLVLPADDYLAREKARAGSLLEVA